MTDFLILFLVMLVSYIIGSIPAGFIMGKLLKGVDIRVYGSGNIGAANVLRVFGKLPALLVLTFDVFKGYFVTYFFPIVLQGYISFFEISVSKSILGFCVIAGHIWPIFLKFKGGKGVATSIGVLIALDIKIAIIIFAVWLITLLFFRYVSLSSIVASVISPLLFLVFNTGIELILFSSALAFIISFKHNENIKRLIEGTEKKIGQKADLINIKKS